MTVYLHRSAAVRRPRKDRRPEPVTPSEVPAIGRAEALRLAGGDKTRLPTLAARTILVTNQGAEPRADVAT